MTGRLKDRSGFALVLTLVVTALMVAVVVEMIHQVYVDVSLSRGFRDGQQASILAESGVTGGARLLQRALSNRAYTSLSDKWAEPIKLDDEVGTVVITISEDSAKINLNDLVYENGQYQDFTLAALKRLGRRLKLPEELWGSLADWLDSDDLPRSGGVESSYYRSLKPGYDAHDGKLATITELSLVRGITPELFGKLQPFVTIWSELPLASSKININTAPKEVLAALDDGIDDRMAESIMERRRLTPFKSTGELSQVSGLNPGAVSRLSGSSSISVKGNLFRIIAVARVKDAARTVEAVVRLGGSAPEYLTWLEY
ncbi:MAG TPA: general secretion pathway protein GspK [Geobacter sp.]|nr:general secretion pathway protein GspK [Geobacter sp.]HCE66362.1 general secretion pathway protein GspK [Geobacter sp.]